MSVSCCLVAADFTGVTKLDGDRRRLYDGRMMPHDAATWWTAFGAMSQAAGSVATFAAVVLSLWIVTSERKMRARGSACIMVMFAGDGTPGQYMVSINVLNTGVRPFQVNSVGWRTGWFLHGPIKTEYRFAIQNDSVMVNQNAIPMIVEPGQSKGFHTLVADMKNPLNEVSHSDLFRRRLFILGEAPIWAMVNISGRKPVMVRVKGTLADFLRTREHANTTADIAA